MKIDMVNPIPASNPKPKICFQLALFGNFEKPNLTDNQENKVTPIGFPKANPKIIPKPKKEINLEPDIKRSGVNETEICDKCKGLKHKLMQCICEM